MSAVTPVGVLRHHDPFNPLLAGISTTAGTGRGGILAARTDAAAWAYLLFGGVIYLVLWIYGLVIDRDSSANFVPVNAADYWLHMGLAGVKIGAALALRRRTDDPGG